MAKSRSNPVFHINATKTLSVILAITGFLLVLHLVLQFLVFVVDAPVPDTLVGRFNVDNEISIPTWWIQTLLLIPALLGLVIYKLRVGEPGRIGWLLFSAIFLFLSVDEGAMLHESVVTKLREWTTDGTATGLANHLWLIPAIFILAVLFILFMRFARTLPKRTVVLLGIGIAVFVFGGVIYEAFGLMVFSDTGGFWYSGLNVAIEEGLEMSGAALAVYALLDYLANYNRDINFRISSKA